MGEGDRGSLARGAGFLARRRPGGVAKQEMRRLKKQVSKEEYTQEFSAVMWPLGKNRKDLQPKEGE